MASIRSALVLIAVISALCSAQEPQQRPHVAVFPLEGKSITATEASVLTDRLQSELQQLGKFRLIERNQIDAILEEQGMQLDECSSSECVVELGQLVNAEFIVTGSVGKVANVYTVSAKLINVETGDIERTATDDVIGDLGQVLMESMRAVAVDLTPGLERKFAALRAEGHPSAAPETSDLTVPLVLFGVTALIVITALATS